MIDAACCADANKWFDNDKIREVRDDGVSLGKIRLEAATGQNFSPHVDIPEPDGIMERARQLVLHLAQEHPAGRWEQFLTTDGAGLRWAESVIVSVSRTNIAGIWVAFFQGCQQQSCGQGISHGSTTAARLAKHQELNRVVLFSGPRDQFDSWHGFPSATPTERYFAFTHVEDGGWPDHYARSWSMLGLGEHGDLEDVTQLPAPYNGSRTLISTADVGGDAGVAHTTVVPGGSSGKDEKGGYIYEDAWRYLFCAPA